MLRQLEKVNTHLLNRLVTLGIIFLSLACKKENSSVSENKEPCKYKNQLCDSALFTLSNRTQDTIFYGVGTNMWEDTLLPGQQRILKYGKVNVTYDTNCEKSRKTWSTHQLSSNWGDWAFNIDHCEKRSAFEYTDVSKSAIKLYDITGY